MDTNKMRDLKELAEAATAGEWTCSNKHDGRFWHIQAGSQAIGATHAAGRKSPMAGVFEANARFIAAASPATVLALLADIEQLTEEVALDDKIIAERDRLVDAIPQCAAHGQCVPYAIQWVKDAQTDLAVLREVGDNLKAENEKMRSFLADVSRTSGDKWAVMAARNLLKEFGHD